MEIEVFERPPARKLISLAALAEMLGINRSRIYALAESGVIKVIHVNGSRGVEPAEAERLRSLASTVLSASGRAVVRFDKI